LSRTMRAAISAWSVALVFAMLVVWAGLLLLS
jgi:hypothetical protein